MSSDSDYTAWVIVPIRRCHFQDPSPRDKLQEPSVGRCHLLLEPEVRGALELWELVEPPLSNGISVASATSYRLNGLENSKSILRTMLSIYKLLGAHPRKTIAVPFSKSPFTSWELSSFLRGQWDKPEWWLMPSAPLVTLLGWLFEVQGKMHLHLLVFIGQKHFTSKLRGLIILDCICF